MMEHKKELGVLVFALMEQPGPMKYVTVYKFCREMDYVFGGLFSYRAKNVDFERLLNTFTARECPGVIVVYPVDITCFIKDTKYELDDICQRIRSKFKHCIPIQYTDSTAIGEEILNQQMHVI